MHWYLNDVNKSQFSIFFNAKRAKALNNLVSQYKFNVGLALNT